MPYQTGMMPGMNMRMNGNMHMGGEMGMNGYGMGMNQPTFGQQPGGAQFDPMLLAQAQAQAHAAIQAQMQMAMMQQMQAQMGMGLLLPGQAMLGGIQAGQYGQYGQSQQSMYGSNPPMENMPGQMGYYNGAGQQEGSGEMYWQGQQGGFYSPGAE
jgi:mRNA (2'-O-methyladenosine-N6-)-methyltransferase